MALCSIHFIGNIGQAPEMRYTPNGKAVTKFTVAVNQSKPDGRGGWTDETNWFNVDVWGDQAERVAEKFAKGDRVFVEGRFKAREYTARDGARRTSLDVSANQVIFAMLPPKDGEFVAAEGMASTPAPSTVDPDDDLPF